MPARHDDRVTTSESSCVNVYAITHSLTCLEPVSGAHQATEGTAPLRQALLRSAQTRHRFVARQLVQTQPVYVRLAKRRSQRSLRLGGEPSVVAESQIDWLPRLRSFASHVHWKQVSAVDVLNQPLLQALLRRALQLHNPLGRGQCGIRTLETPPLVSREYVGEDGISQSSLGFEAL